MIIKLIGITLIISACGGFGIRIAFAYKKEVKTVNNLLKCLDFISNELCYRLTPLPELCHIAVTITEGSIRDFFGRLEKELNKHISPNASTCATAILESMPDIPPSIRALLQEICDSLGQFDSDGQLKSLESVRLQAVTYRNAQTKDMDMRLRSYQTLGLCAGAALAILLI